MDKKVSNDLAVNLNTKLLINNQEVVGPVSVILTYRSVEEAVQIANDSELGLKAYLFGTKDDCLRLVPQLHVGTVQINGGSPLRPDGPMNACKLSGLGSEWGIDGLREFLVPQHIDYAVYIPRRARRLPHTAKACAPAHKARASLQRA